MAFVATWLPYIAAGASALSQKKQSDDQADYNNQQAALAEQQGIIAGNQARADEEAQRRKSRQIMGEQAAAMAQSGTGLGGSNALLTRQSAVDAELDALNIRYQGLLKSSALKAQASSLRGQANALRRSGNLLAGTALLTGISNARTNKTIYAGY